MVAAKIHLVRSAAESTARDVVWSAIRALRTFTLPELLAQSRVNRDVARGYLRALVNSKHVARTSEARKRARPMARAAVAFTLVRDVGVNAPQITRTGQPTRYGRGRLHLWRAMKVLRDFSHVDLAISASTDEVRISRVVAYDYIKHLAAAGYLVRSQAAHSGSRARAASAARYRLIPSRWTGPVPPRVTARKDVYDPNLGCRVTAQTWSAPR